MLYTIPGCTWDGVLPGILKILGQGGEDSYILYTILGCTWNGVLSGTLKILGQGDIAVHCIPSSRDELGMACATRDSEDTWTGEYSRTLYTIPGCTWDGVCYLGFLRYTNRGRV